MLLEELAAHPGAPDVILSELVTIATGPGEHNRRATKLRMALARNPRTSPAQVRALADLPLSSGAISVLTAALARPGVGATFALEVLGTGASATALAAAIGAVSDPTWQLAEHALRVSSAPSVATALLELDDLRTDLLWAAIDIHCARTTHIASNIQARIAAALTRELVRAQTRSEHAAVVERVRALRAAAHRPDLAARLDRLDATFAAPEPGTPRWYASADRTLEQVLDYLTGRPVAAWKVALRQHRDPSGRLCDAALAARLPGASARSVMTLIIGDKRHPMGARLRALVALAATGAQVPALAPELIMGAPTDVAVEFIDALASTWRTGTAQPHDTDGRLVRPSTYLPHVLCRSDLTSEHLDLLDPVVAASEMKSGNGVTAYSWGAYVATYPSASTAQRAAGRAHLFSHPDGRRISSHEADLVDLVATFTDLTGEPASAAQYGRTLNVETLTPYDVRTFPGLRWLLGAALDELDPADDALSTVLVSLAAGATGTLGDLITTARAVTS